MPTMDNVKAKIESELVGKEIKTLKKQRVILGVTLLTLIILVLLGIGLIAYQAYILKNYST